MGFDKRVVRIMAVARVGVAAVGRLRRQGIEWCSRHEEGAPVLTISHRISLGRRIDGNETRGQGNGGFQCAPVVAIRVGGSYLWVDGPL